MTDASENKQHLVFAVLLGIAGLLIILIFVTIRSQGADQSSTTTANVTNAAPSIQSIYLTDSMTGGAGTDITLEPNTTKEVYVMGTYSDNNGCDEVDIGAQGVTGNITSTLYRSGLAEGSNCSADDLNCKTVLSCSTWGCDNDNADTIGSFQCTTTLQYFADATDAGAYSAQNWLATATVTDKFVAGAPTPVNSGTGTSEGSEVNSLTAIALGENAGGADIPYGSVALGAVSQEVLTIWRNIGNTAFNPKVSSAAAMNCTDENNNVTTIPVGNQHYATSSGVAYGDVSSPAPNEQKVLSGVATNVAAADHCYAKAQGTGASSSTGQIFWKIKLPSTGVAGTCTGTNVVNADGC